MAQFKIYKNKNYTVVSNYHLQDMNLSLKSKGLLTQMLSLPPDWDYSIKGLAAINKDGIDAIKSALNELEKYNYLTRKKIRDKKGKILDIEYSIYEFPQTEENDLKYSASDENNDGNPEVDFPLVGFPLVGFPHTGNPTQLNTKELNNKKLNTNINNNCCCCSNNNNNIYIPKKDYIKNYINNNNYTFDPEYFYNYYSSRNWYIGNKPIENFDQLKSIMDNWQKKESVTKKLQSPSGSFNSYNQKIYSNEELEEIVRNKQKNNSF